MTTTLFAIFGIALVATLAWVITRIVNIFVELEEVNEQAVYLRDDIEALEKKWEDLEQWSRIHKDKIECIQSAHKLIVKHLDNIDELLKKAEEGEVTTSKCLELMRGIIDKQDEKMISVVEMGNALQEAQKALLKMAEELIGKYSNGDN